MAKVVVNRGGVDYFLVKTKLTLRLSFTPVSSVKLSLERLMTVLACFSFYGVYVITTLWSR